MNVPYAQRLTASWLMAFSDLLTGRPGMHLQLNRRLCVIVGPSVHMLQLLHWGGWVRQTGIPIVAVTPGSDDAIPQVSLVCMVGDQLRIFENCLLWQRRDGAGAHLIPDDFRCGAFSVGPDLALKHHRRAPTPNRRAASDGTSRAYSRLLEVVMDQMLSDRELDLPLKMEQRAA